jgi:hypothetical protein
MTNITLKTLQETREQLTASYEQLIELQGELINGNASLLKRHELVIKQIQRLKDAFIEQHEALSTVLTSGTKLRPGQFQSLERFASNHGLDIYNVRLRSHFEGGFVTECDFSRMNLTTLSGLEGLVRLRSLNVAGNPDLRSLKDIPLQAIEVIYLTRCGLTGDLAELAGANMLKKLLIGANKGLTSLKGVPTQAIEYIDASDCDLTGDLSELSGADMLIVLKVAGNESLGSLTGTPTQAIQEIYAKGCSLAGDHTFLSKAPNLVSVDVSFNPALTLDKTKFNSNVEVTV